MPGKYDFPGIKKIGTRAASLVLSSTAWGAAILKSPFKPIVEMLMGYLIEWLANKGLVIINLGFIYIDGNLDQSKFDKAFDEALERLKVPGLPETEKAAIDEKIKNAFRNFAHLNDKPKQPKPPKS